MILPTNDEDLKDWVIKAFDFTSQYLDTERVNWRTYYKLYRSYVNEKNYPFRHKLFIPWVFSLVETILPRFVAGLLYRNPLLEVQKAHPFTSDRAVQSAANLLNRKWMTDNKTWMALLMMVKESLLYGTSHAKIVWNKEYTRKPKWTTTFVDGRPIASMSENEMLLTENRPRIEHIDVFDVVPDLLHGQNPEFVAHVKVLPFDEIENGPIKYHNLDKLWDAGNHNISRDGDWRMERLAAVERNHPDMVYDIHYPRHLTEMTVREHTRDGIVIRVITVGNRSVLLRNEVISYWPWCHVWNYPNPHEMLGTSEIANLESLQHNMNNHVNMLLDNLLLSMTKMWLVGDQAEADLDTFTIEPSGVMQVADISAVQEVKFNDIPSGAFNMHQLFSTTMQSTAGINDYLRGANPPRKEFATTVIALQQASEARIDTKIKMFEKLGLASIASKFIEVAQYELMEPEYVYNKQTKDFASYWAQDIEGLMDIDTHASSMGMNELTRQQLTEFAQIAGQLLGPETPVQARVEILKSIGKTFNNDDIDEAMKSVSQFLQQQQQQPNQVSPTPGQAGPTIGVTPQSNIPGLANTIAAAQGQAPGGPANPTASK